MPPAYLYHPVVFFLITLLIAFALGPVASYLSHKKGMERFQFPLLLFALCVPCMTSVAMIYASQNEGLIQDFWMRLMDFKISFNYLMVILFFMPCVLFLSTGVSLLFGYSRDQFSLANDFSVMKGWAVLGIVMPLVLAPIIEEIGWRGYGVDSLRAFFNLFTTSVIFGILWAVWHLPAFFIKGYYHNQLWHLGIVYVVNFFVSVFVLAILMNWVYYKTGRSIPAVILFHSVLNLFSMAFKTEPFTKCIVTVFLFIVSIFVIVYDRVFFFSDSLIN
jgi:membrane protease YdiL (CAAX protease family)